MHTMLGERAELLPFHSWFANAPRTAVLKSEDDPGNGVGLSEKPIRLTLHARGYLDRRGFTEAEVEEAIRTSVWLPAKSGRLEAAMDFPFERRWNGRHYATKQVRAIFVDETDEIVVVTVYTYYF